MQLHDAITNRIDQARALTWRPGRRVIIDVDGESATLLMSWVTADGSAMIPDDPRDPTVAGDHVVRLDGDLTPGVSARGWSSLPETTDEIEVPDEAAVAAAARYVGATHYDRMDYPDGRVTWRLVGVGTASDIANLTQCGQALYGDRWQSALAHDLGVNPRRVREWLSGDRRVPPGIWSDIADLLRDRREQIGRALAEIG